MACIGFLPGCDREAKLDTTRAQAGAGDASAQNELGRVYFFGAGLEPDNVSAYAWTAAAEANGHPEAKKNKLNIAKKMTPQQVDEAKKLAEQLQKKVDDNKKAAEQ